MVAQCTGGGVLGRRMVGGRVWLSDSDDGLGQIQGNYGHEKGQFAVDGGQEWMIARIDLAIGGRGANRCKSARGQGHRPRRVKKSFCKPRLSM